MKYIYRILLFCAGLLVQWWCSTYFAFFWGLSPQILLLLTVAIASTVGPLAGQSYAFGWGLFLDALSPHLFGANTLTLTLLGYLVGNSRRQMDVSNPASQALLVMVVSYLYILFLALLAWIFKGQPFWPGWVVFLLMPIVNGAVSPLGFAVVEHYIHP